MPTANELEDSATADEEAETEAKTEVKGRCRRKNRQIDWDKIETYLAELAPRALFKSGRATSGRVACFSHAVARV